VGKSFNGRRYDRPTIKPPKVAFPRDIGITYMKSFYKPNFSEFLNPCNYHE
jgi:hypothetical protein